MPQKCFNNDAYNHYSCRWDVLRKAISSLGEQDNVGELFQSFVMGSSSDGVAAASDLRNMTIGGEKKVKYLGHFNTKELLWHMVLFKEACVTAGARASYNILSFRDAVFHEPLFGSGAVAGLQVFYPHSSRASLKDDVAELSSYLERRHHLVFPCVDFLQWCLCLLHKVLNSGYKRSYGFRYLTADQLAEWARRVDAYPSGLRMFQQIAHTAHRKDEWAVFLEACKKLQDAISTGRLKGQNSCRACWRKLGVLDVDRSATHSFYQSEGCFCEEAKRARCA